MGTLFDILHIAAAVFIVGPMAIIPMTAMRALRAREAGQVRVLAKSTNIFGLLSLLVVVLGFGAMGTSDPKYHVSFADTWIWLSLVLYVVALGLTLFVVVPALRRAADGIEAGGTAAAGGEAAGDAVARSGGYGMIAGTSGIASLLLLIVVVLMVWKP